jgi:hypothetical protein
MDIATLARAGQARRQTAIFRGSSGSAMAPGNHAQ